MLSASRARARARRERALSNLPVQARALVVAERCCVIRRVGGYVVRLGEVTGCGQREGPCLLEKRRGVFVQELFALPSVFIGRDEFLTLGPHNPRSRVPEKERVPGMARLK